MERRDVAVNINDVDDDGGKFLRESSYDFWHDTGKQSDSGFEFTHSGNKNTAGDNSPSKLTRQFPHNQKASGEVRLDMELEMEGLRNDPSSAAPRTNISTTNTPRGGSLPPVAESYRGKTPSYDSFFWSSANHRVSCDSNPRVSGAGSVESIRTSQFKDSPQKEELVGGYSGAEEVVKCSSRDASFRRNSKEKPRSRLMDPPERIVKGGNNSIKEEEDDPLSEEDIPDELKKDKFDFWELLEWVSFVLIIGALVCSLTIPFWKRRSLWKMKLWKWEVLVLVLICGRLVSSWIVRIIVFFIERNFFLRKRVLYFVYGVRKAVQNCLWLGLVLIAWHYLFDKKVERETRSKALRTVTKVLVCLLVGVLLWLVKTLMGKVLASSFHVSLFFDRIQGSLFNQYVIETLSGPPLIEIQRNEEEEEKLAEEVRMLQNAGVTVPSDLMVPMFSTHGSARVIGSGILKRSPRILNPKSPKLSRIPSTKGGEEYITIDHLHKLNPKNVSAWNMKRLISTVRHGSLSTVDEQMKDSPHEGQNATKITSEYDAKSAARKIFHNVAGQGSRYIYLDDIMRFMREDEALKTMGLFEGASGSMKISKSALKYWVVNTFRERRGLALTLNDTKAAVKKLHRVADILVGIIIVVVWLLILGIATTRFLLVMSSQLVVVAFIFGNTCKTVFEAIIFLFVMHPFDVGDRCEIEGVQLVVEEMNILTTVFLRYDNQKVIYPNSVLATKAISNFYRSPNMGDSVEFCIHITTPSEKIDQMKQRITSYIENKKDYWYPAPMIILKDMEELDMVRVAVWPTHRMNHQDMEARFIRRSLLVDEVVKVCKEMDVEYRMRPLDINVRSLPPMSSAGHQCPDLATSGI